MLTVVRSRITLGFLRSLTSVASVSSPVALGPLLKHSEGSSRRFTSTLVDPKQSGTLLVDGKEYPSDEWTNVTPSILQHIQRKLHLREKHPMNLLKQRIANHFNKAHVNRRGNPIFSVFDQLPSVVTIDQNFDSLLVPPDHPSRARADSYYLNRSYLLRAHTSAHQRDLIASGLDAFLIIGDVYRRDEIDKRHYPVFHQVEGVRLFTKQQLFKEQTEELTLFESAASRGQLDNKQTCHSMETAKMLEFDLKNTLEGLVLDIFDEKLDVRWVDTYFPFTHPSFELEVKVNDVWVELLGCGIVQQAILKNSGVEEKVGWAFGVGLERIAMLYYNIDDIRTFWSEDPGFHAQFNFTDPERRISFQPISKHPECIADISFWIPEGFLENDFYDMVRSVGGPLVQEVSQIDVFKHPKTGRISHCYRITYRHMEKTLTQEEANAIHNAIASKAESSLSVELRTK